MSVDEFEAIRLIDHMDLTQEECAEQMGVARTTVQAIYNQARKKVARVLVDSIPLTISGGTYQLYGGNWGSDGRLSGACKRNGGGGLEEASRDDAPGEEA